MGRMRRAGRMAAWVGSGDGRRGRWGVRGSPRDRDGGGVDGSMDGWREPGKAGGGALKRTFLRAERAACFRRPRAPLAAQAWPSLGIRSLAPRQGSVSPNPIPKPANPPIPPSSRPEASPFPRKPAFAPRARIRHFPACAPGCATQTQAAGLCSWGRCVSAWSRSIFRLPVPPKRRRGQAPARGAWAREYGAEGAGRRHCRPPCRGAGVCLLGAEASSASPSPQRTPQGAGPCSWACRRQLPPPPHPERNKAPKPPARGAWARQHGAEGYWPPALPARRSSMWAGSSVSSISKPVS